MTDAVGLLGDRGRVLRQPLPLFWELRLYLVCTLHGLPVGYAPGRDEGRRAAGPPRHPRQGDLHCRPGQVLIGDKGYHGSGFEATLTAAIWHNEATGRPVMRSLVAYDH